MFYKANSFNKLLLVFLILWPFFSQSQNIYVVKELPEGKQLISSTDPVQIKYFLNNYIQENQSIGYFDITYTEDLKPDSVFYTIQKGQQFHWSVLSKGNLPASYLGKYNFEHKFDSGKPFSHDQINKLFSSVIKRAENKGYPFAYVHLDSIKINEREIKAVINFNPGPYITFDSLKLSGTGKINKKWLEAYLEIRQGQPFSQKKLNQIEEKVDELLFLKLNDKPVTTFQNDEATVNIDLKHQTANQFDAVIGFAPGVEDNLLITGKANVELQNLFNRGHNFLFDWRRIKKNTQELELIYAIPNLFNTPISVAGKVDLFRQDVLFFNRNLQLDLNYSIGRLNFGAFTRSFKSIKTDEEENRDIKDITINYYGMAGGYSTLNNILRPTKGIKIESSIAAGSKEMDIVGFPASSTQLDIYFNAQRYQGISSGFLYNNLLSRSIINDNVLFNELLRVGGVNSIRGFPENYFFVSQYNMLLNEYHWLFNDGSSFFILADAAYLKDDTYKYAYSLGLGFDLKVNNGIFELIYALGKEENIPVSFDRSVLHFGYRAVF
ncbi:MAG: hypothetical protein ACNS60_03115 [Candidatus Cyclobacteriaceae bacterium M2_1C_046]